MLLFIYFLKVTLVSALLYGYYILALRNRKFHHYNRFYLLTTVLLSLIIPLIKINFLHFDIQKPGIIKFFSAINNTDVYVKTSAAKQYFLSDYTRLALYAFVVITAVAFIFLIFQLIKIFSLIKANPGKVWNDVHFVFTKSTETPFSFFKYIFWNENINMDSDEGRQILQHELTHVKQHHSADKLFLNVVLAAFWANPFFWIIRNELYMLHEFLADQKAISNGDANAFAAMLLTAAYPQQSFTLSNSFFHSPIKRRLIMFTTSKKPSYSYLRRLMILPLLSFVIIFFSFKLKEENLNKFSNNLSKGDIQLSGDKNLRSAIYKVIERFVGVEPCEGCAKTGANVLEISNLDNSTQVKTVFASDNYFDFGNDKVLKTKLDEISKEFNVPFDVIVPVYFFSYDDEKKLSPNPTQPSPELMKAVQEKIDNLGKQKTVYDPVVIVFFLKNSKDDIETKLTESAINNSDTIEARFPGGAEAWKRYLEKNLDANVPVVKDRAPAGIYTVKLQFIVLDNGDITDVSVIQSPAGCPSCAIEAVDLIKKGPKWEPMTIDGKKVTSQPVQFISFKVE